MLSLRQFKDIIGRRAISSNLFIALSVLFIILVDNHAFWSSLLAVIDITNPQMILLLVASFCIIFSVCFTFLVLFGSGRLLKPLTAFLLITASITAYYMDAYGIFFDDVMILNIIETNVHEAMELFDLKMLLHVLITGVLPVVILYQVKINPRPFAKEFYARMIAVSGILMVSGVIVYSSYKDFSFVFRENREIGFLVNPVYPLRSVYRLAAKEIRKSNRKFAAVFSDAHRVQPVSAPDNNGRHNLFVIVVGETARAQNFHVNGYKRNTTPELEKHNIINFKNVSACGTATAISLPCMFSGLEHDDFDNNEARTRQNLLDALNIAGLQVLWRENNPDCKGVCDRVATDNYDALHMDAFCENGQCFDDVLFNGLDEYINSLSRDAVIVLHTQGSHGPAYYRRYPEAFRRYLPECRSSTVQDCSDIEVTNAYDNTIVYTDYFLAKVIDYLKQKSGEVNSAMLYISDHGESLGEYGVYLHGLPYFLAPEYQKKVPMIFWASTGFMDNKQLDSGCLQAKADEALSHDNLLHSVMGIMDVSSQLYKADLDVFDSCRYTTKVVKSSGNGLQDKI